MGGSILDPAGGLAILNARIGRLGIRVRSSPWAMGDVEAIAKEIKKRADGSLTFLIGDSCGANRLPLIASMVFPRKVAYIGCIQASIYCQAGCPHIGHNVENAHIFYSDFAHTMGLGTYIPVCLDPPNNRGATQYVQSYVPAAHPDDNDVERVQNPILNDIKRILKEHEQR